MLHYIQSRKVLESRAALWPLSVLLGKFVFCPQYNFLFEGSLPLLRSRITKSIEPPSQRVTFPTFTLGPAGTWGTGGARRLQTLNPKPQTLLNPTSFEPQHVRPYSPDTASQQQPYLAFSNTRTLNQIRNPSIILGILPNIQGYWAFCISSLSHHCFRVEGILHG